MVLSYCKVVGKGLEPVREDSHAATFNVSTDGPEPPRTENRCNALYFSCTALHCLLCFVLLNVQIQYFQRGSEG